ncbi:Dinucleoside triphosphate hydrolase [Coemansia spiralis]|uniref:Bis(5'-adenosyl)-triphosphatase n=2 Tax=Coemansia TaxID=4863 RepID=A0A9W8G8K5_9FUNG|nr:HIT-like domain-containing protein [Coemansia spiralis]KAJ1991513.1 Dinucleoside triphosphate hydrolase [Coemansia umbellata]KAJ2621532.1 Dinucleoside triphosphate hydrolase [Coemansia sp. RSA 1358]KAJ2676744.1 Dinucleoside triphosphate hydrolase [Coemansia spiralis]
MSAPAGKAFVRFGPNAIPLKQMFLISKLSFAFVNLKPVRPGHVLIATRRDVARFNDLTSEEVSDLLVQGQRVSKVIERVYKASSLTLAIQDGAAAGQTVPHVHLHVIPRHMGDFASNDDIYSKLEGADNRVATSHVDNEERTPRSAEDMAAEAELLRKEIGDWNEAEVV